MQLSTIVSEDKEGMFMKIRSCGFSIVLILIIILNNLGIIGVDESNIGEYVSSDASTVANFIEDNFDSFVNEYKNTTNETWNASSIEKRLSIVIDECGDVYDGVFLDFDGDNGYAVVGKDYEMLDFSTIGESPFKDISSAVYYYSASTGYSYLNGNSYLSIDESNNAEEDFFIETENSKHYNGQEENAKGCGKIHDTDLYVKDRYGSGWTLCSNKTKSLPMTGYTQWNMSCYRKYSIENDKLSSTTWSEGNCWVISAYNVLQYMAENKWTNMPKRSNTVSYTPLADEPYIYSKYFDSNGNNKTKLLYYNGGKSSIHEYFLVDKVLSFPKLYTEIRKHVNAKYKKIESGSIYRTSEIIEYIANKYNHKTDAQEHISWKSYADTSTKKISDGYPLLWSTSNDTYGSHTMAVCGYKYYKKTSGWWIFKTTSYKLFYELRDGHSSSPRFYDISGHVGFSAIISLE